MKIKHLLITVLLLGGCTGKEVVEKGALSQGPSKVVDFSIVHQSNRYGSLEPCGCQVSPFGGIDREANAVEAIRKERKNVLYVDAGNLFVPINSTIDLKILHPKSELITDMLNKMGLDAYLPGPLDYELGVDFLKTLSKRAKFSFVASNVTEASGKTVFPPYAMLERDGVKFAVLGLVSPEKMQVNGLKVEDPKVTLARLLPEVHKLSPFVIVLSQLGNTTDTRLAETNDIQVLVGSDAILSLDGAQAVRNDQALLVDGADMGFRLGRLDINLSLPFKGFNSMLAVAEQRETIEGLEKVMKKDPSNANVKVLLDSLKSESTHHIVEGGSVYTAELLKLDRQRFGMANEITKMKKKQKQILRKRAIGE